MATVRELVTKWGFEVDDAALKKMEQDTRQLRTSFVKLGVVATAALAAMVLPAAAVEAAITDTLTLSEETGVAFDELSDGMTKKALEMSSRLGISAAEVGKGFYQVLSTGAKALSPEFNALAEVALKMAKVVGLEPSVAIERLNDTLKAFGLQGTEAERVADVLFNTSKLAATTVPQLTQALSVAAPAARLFGVDLETTSALLAGLAEGGIKAEKAGTGLQAIFSRLQKPTKDISGTLATLGVKVTDNAGNFRDFTDILLDMRKGLNKQTEAQKAASIVTIAGQEHLKTLGTIINNDLDLTIRWSEGLREAEKGIEEAFGIKMSSATEQSKRFFIIIKNLAAQIGLPLLKPIAAIAKKLGEFVEKIRKLIATRPELAQLISQWGGFVLVATALGSVLGIVAASLKLFAINMGLSGLAIAGSMFWMVALAAMLLILFGVIAKNKASYGEFLADLQKTNLSQVMAEFIGWVLRIDEASEALKKLEGVLETIFDLLSKFDKVRELFKKGFFTGLDILGKAAGGIARESERLRAGGGSAPRGEAGDFLSQAESLFGFGKMGAAIPAPGQTTTVNNGGSRTANITINIQGDASEQTVIRMREELSDLLRETESNMIPESIR